MRRICWNPGRPGHRHAPAARASASTRARAPRRPGDRGGRERILDPSRRMRPADASSPIGADSRRTRFPRPDARALPSQAAPLGRTIDEFDEKLTIRDVRKSLFPVPCDATRRIGSNAQVVIVGQCTVDEGDRIRGDCPLALASPGYQVHGGRQGEPHEPGIVRPTEVRSGLPRAAAREHAQVFHNPAHWLAIGRLSQRFPDLVERFAQRRDGDRGSTVVAPGGCVLPPPPPPQPESATIPAIASTRLLRTGLLQFTRASAIGPPRARSTDPPGCPCEEAIAAFPAMVLQAPVSDSAPHPIRRREVGRFQLPQTVLESLRARPVATEYAFAPGTRRSGANHVFQIYPRRTGQRLPASRSRLSTFARSSQRFSQIVEVLAGDLEHHGGEQQQPDEVGHRHQPVESVGQVPDQIHLHIGEGERGRHPQGPVDE